MYVGVLIERGKRIPDREAFGYASERCLYGTDEEKQTFMEILKESKDIEEFSRILVEWFYSDNWIYDPHDSGKQSWIIRFSDNSMQGCYCTYRDAVLLGRKLADEKGLGFVVV